MIHPTFLFHHRRKHSNPLGWYYNGAARTVITANAAQEWPTGAGTGWSLSLWFKLTANAGVNTSWLFGQGNLGVNSSLNIFLYQASHANANKLKIEIKDTGGVTTSIMPALVTPGESRAWQNLVITYDFDTTRLKYLLGGSTVDMDAAYTWGGMTAPNIRLGDSTDQANAELNGHIKDVAAWFSVLSAPNIAALAAGSKASILTPTPDWNVQAPSADADNPVDVDGLFSLANTNVVGSYE